VLGFGIGSVNADVLGVSFAFANVRSPSAGNDVALRRWWWLFGQVVVSTWPLLAGNGASIPSE
jgi:hypothetical protein